jgi:hypothetical protein
MIKFALRRNLIYPLQLLIFNFVRETETEILSRLYTFDNPLVFTSFMFIGEFLTGLIIYLYQKKITAKKQITENARTRQINLALMHKEIKIKDSTFKIMFLIFCAGLMDFVQFVLSLNSPQFINVSASFGMRLSGFLTIVDALYYYFVLKFPILRHQFFSLVGIGICLILVIITEFIFQEVNIFFNHLQLFILLLLTFVQQFCSAMVDSNEKYLFEYDQINPFFTLLFEGLIGFILSFIYGIFYDPFEQFRKINSSINFTVIILLLVLYIILSGLKNAFRVQTTKIYSPMTTTFMDYILNPLYLIIYFVINEDFITKGKKNYAKFFINFFLALIMTFFGLIYNEFIIVFFFHLEKDTHQEVSKRACLAEIQEKELISFNTLTDLGEEEEEKTYDYVY